MTGHVAAPAAGLVGNTATCNPQLGVTPASYGEYARAAALLWGPAGEYAAAEFTRLNRELFAGSLPPIPVVIGLAAYGHCLGLTRHRSRGWLDAPRISLASECFAGSRRMHGGPRQVTDVLTHELIHAALMFRGRDPSHNASPWCDLITELSPAVLGRDILARPVRTHRVPNPERETNPAAPKTIVRKIPDPGALPQAVLARWPYSLRPPGWYNTGQPIPVPTY